MLNPASLNNLPHFGDRVRIHPFEEPARVVECVPLGNRIRLEVIFLERKHAETFLLTPEEFRNRVSIIPTLAQAFAAAQVLPRTPFALYLESLRMRLAYTFDPHYAISVTQVDLLPHQVDAVYNHILPQARIRFLLADDPGLGKTIMAGLVLKELKARGMVRRTIIVVPAALQEQWRREMWDWFREDFTFLNRAVLQGLYAGDFFDRNPQIITSIDFAKREGVRELLARQQWDLVIVDEAHKFSATRRPSGKPRKTKRYQLGEAIAPRANHLLFLTATPHRGDDAAYFMLLELLEPRFFANEHQLREAVRSYKGLPFVLRRSKEQVTDLYGRKLFKKRDVKTLPIKLTDAERTLYQAVTTYVRRWYSRVAGRKDRRSRNVALALTVLQRRMASSLTAIRESLRRRRAKLQRLLEEWEKALEEEEIYANDDEWLREYADATDADRERIEEKAEGLTAAQNPEELREEIREVDELIKLALQAEKAGEEAKLQELEEVIENHLRDHPDEKLLIFTEFKDTLKGLVRKIRDEWGYSTAVIHGGMNMWERVEQERIFRDETQVMVATDAAGEGINLQFCRLMVNYDLPWNPNRLEQRMGRIHRYGQKRDCYIYNLLYPETQEGKVLETLLNKLEIMKQRLGDTVYDVIGTLLEDVRLEELVMRAILARDASEVEVIIERNVEEAVERYRKALEENALAGHHIDLSAVQKQEARSLEMRLVPWDVERFTRLALMVIGGKMVPDRRAEGVFRISVPREFARRYHLEDEAFVRGLRIAFEREKARKADAEFFAPGHPLLEALCEHFLSGKETPVKAVLVSSDERAGSLWLFRGKVTDGEGRPVLERLLAFFHDRESDEVHQIDPRWLWDLESCPPEWKPPEEWVAEIDEAEPLAQAEATVRMEALLKEAQARREREVRIKREWLEKSFEELIRESDRKLMEYARRRDKGEDLRLAIQEEERNYKALIREKKERLEVLERERQLALHAPELIAVALVVPASLLKPVKPVIVKKAEELPAPEEARRRVEEAGMQAVMAYEKKRGRSPQDVSQEYRGYDIISKSDTEMRYIEVKSFATTGPLELTPHEWQMAHRLGDAYWLYVVENTLTEPEITAICNPVATLPSPKEVMGVVKVVFKEWKK